MAELLLEMFGEEIPARMQARAADDLKRLVCDGLKAAELSFEAAAAHVTPRRLILHITGLPKAQPDLREEKRGPKVDAPERAIEGFLRGNGLSREQCEERDLPKGRFLFAVIERQGRPTAEVLADILPKAFADLPWPKSMRWGGGATRWVRPLHSILTLFDGAVVALTFADIASGDQTRGHRFHAPSPITVRDFADYRNKLAAAKVVIDAAERRRTIAAGARRLAREAGLTLVEDEALVAEIAGLVEWPIPMLGRFDKRFLDVPAEVLVATMKVNQKYLSLREGNGNLAPNFITVANLEARDGGKQIIAGNEYVLTARLADAEFFWTQDKKKTLESRLPALNDMVFHAKLGSLGEKVGRIESLAGELARFVPGAEGATARRAAHLCKADLVSGMVHEFPEVQGVMGRYYALNDGEGRDVAEAIAQHYSPAGPSDDCPTAPTALCVALADKLDTLVGFWAIDEKPTGSRDPFALRRAALGVIRMVLENELRLPLLEILNTARRGYGFEEEEEEEGAVNLGYSLLDFFVERLKVHLRSDGVPHDVVQAVFAPVRTGVRGDDLFQLSLRIKILQSFLTTDDGANLLGAYRRAANIVSAEARKTNWVGGDQKIDIDLLVEPEERSLHRELESIGIDHSDVDSARQFETFLQRLSETRPIIDRFFENVTVNVDDSALRHNRLLLLEEVRTLLRETADFGEIEG
jgi:glycyl-tRNA synthetase beta chain